VTLPPQGEQLDRQELKEGDELVAYRIVRTDDRESEDFVRSFLSHEALGLPPRGPEQTHPLIHQGISMYETLKAAVETARRYPAIGAFVAEVRLTHSDEVKYLCWGPPGHLTIWAEPLKVAQAVADTIAV
jgi:hypothetical protein